MKVKFLQIKRALTATLFILIMLAGMTKMMAQDLMRVSKDALMQPMQQKVIDRDSGLNIESDVNNAIPSRTTRTNGELDYTTYDWQSNGTAITRTIVWPDGKINFAYTMASQSNFSDRGTGIGTYDAVNDEWAPSYGRIEAEKTGFGSIARYGQNGIVVAAHTAVLCGVYIIDEFISRNVFYNKAT